MEAVIDVYLIDPTEYISRRGLLRGTNMACLEGLRKTPRNRPKNEAGKPTYQPQRNIRNLKYPDT